MLTIQIYYSSFSACDKSHEPDHRRLVCHAARGFGRLPSGHAKIAHSTFLRACPRGYAARECTSGLISFTSCLLCGSFLNPPFSLDWLFRGPAADLGTRCPLG